MDAFGPVTLMFNWIRRKPKEQPVGGDIAFLGLSDWWMYEFTEAERDLIRRTYIPLGFSRHQIDAGKVTNSTLTVPSFTSNLAGWFNTEDTRHIGYKFLRKADEYRDTDMPPVALHYAMQARCQFFYRWRNHDDFALDAAIDACELGISVSKAAAVAIAKQWGQLNVSHHCFTQLAIIEEKRGNIQRAIELCNTAEADGWLGDWENRRIRLARKLNRGTPPRQSVKII